ncbi:MAG: putative D,D-dipeptide transport system permease protein DdpC [Anaerolineales bacterium]|nr:putative D,D-dipeptide transport system permease protein DdpC [Anaerolineales bacterium]
MTQPITPTGNNELLGTAVAMRKITRLERLLGPDNYRIMQGLFKTPASIAGSILILLFILVAIFAPVLAPPVTPNDPYKIPRDGFKSQPREPGSDWTKNAPDIPFWYKAVTGNEEWVHLFGTAQGQYDIYYGVIWGTRTAFRAGFIVVLSTLLIGVVVGSVSAYYGGLTDNILMRIVDVLMVLPGLMATLILAAVLTPIIGKSTLPVMISLIAFGWLGYSRIIRGDILSVKQRDFILAARVIGAKDSRILFRHIIPNAIVPTMVLASLDIGTVTLSFSALSFLGIGVEVGYADWGQVLAFARNWITSLNTYWYIIVYPGVTLVLFVLGWNLLGDALRDVLDPRMRGKV